MPLTTIDPKTALVVIDLQKGVVAMAGTAAAEIVDRTVQLADAFRERDLPVVLVNVDGIAPGRTDVGRFSLASLPPDWTEIVPELAGDPRDHLVTKQRVGAFLGTDLDDYLQQRGVTQIVLTGIATGSGVESTARSAYDLGYNVTFVLDTMADRSAEAHRYCAEDVFPRLGETTSTAALLDYLNANSKP